MEQQLKEEAQAQDAIRRLSQAFSDLVPQTAAYLNSIAPLLRGAALRRTPLRLLVAYMAALSGPDDSANATPVSPYDVLTLKAAVFERVVGAIAFLPCEITDPAEASERVAATFLMRPDALTRLRDALDYDSFSHLAVLLPDWLSSAAAAQPRIDRFKSEPDRYQPLAPAQVLVGLQGSTIHGCATQIRLLHLGSTEPSMPIDTASSACVYAAARSRCVDARLLPLWARGACDAAQIDYLEAHTVALAESGRPMPHAHQPSAAETDRVLAAVVASTAALCVLRCAMLHDSAPLPRLTGAGRVALRSALAALHEMVDSAPWCAPEPHPLRPLAQNVVNTKRCSDPSGLPQPFPAALDATASIAAQLRAVFSATNSNVHMVAIPEDLHRVLHPRSLAVDLHRVAQL
jgi:hypothetical protein